MRLGGCRGQTYYAGEGYDHGVWYRAWVVKPHLIKQPYRYRQNNFSAATRKALLHAANGRCQVCGSANKMQVDHLVPVAYGGTAELENGLVLCDVCHRAKTAIQIRDPRVPVPARPSRGPEPSPRWQYHLTGTPPYWLVLPDGEQPTFATPGEIWLWIAQHAVEIDRQQRTEKARCEQEYLAWSAEERRAQTRARLEADRKRLEKRRKRLERLTRRLAKQGKLLEKRVRQQG
jgi:5-methylcytosine-specific restriction protein A